MFDRVELKNQAKAIMKNRFIQMVLVCVLGSLLSGNLMEVNINVETNVATLDFMNSFRFAVNYQKALMMAVPVAIVSILWGIFVINPFQLGILTYFKRCSHDEAEFSDVLSGFQYNYGHNVQVLFRTDLSIFLWSLCFIIPGIMKSFSYFFVPYLLTDYPELDADELMALSEKMAVGIRFDIFVLQLSFILWNLLAGFCALFTLGLSVVLVQPYIEQTNAQLYQWALIHRLGISEESNKEYASESDFL